MEPLLEDIRIALAPDAPVEARAAAVAACQTIIAKLQPNTAEPSPAERSPTPSQIAGMVAALRGVPSEQLLDLAISKLRAALPAGTSAPQPSPLKFHIVPIPAPRGGV